MTQAHHTRRLAPPSSWQGALSEYPRDTPVHRLFEARAARTPDFVALLSTDARFTYARLNARANHLAHLLIARQVIPGAHVAVCLDRSADLIITLLAILKAGACCVPLDPCTPADRLQRMMRDSAASFIVTRRTLAGSLPVLPAGRLFLEDIPPAGEPSKNPGIPVSADAPACIFFTSGSTSRLKGVIIPHRAIVCLVRGQGYACLNHAETFLHLAPASSKISIFETWAPLLNGGRLAIAPQGQLSLDQIAGTIRLLGVTSMCMTPGLLNLMADRHLAAFSSLHQLLAGGDLLSIPPVRKLIAAHPRLRVIHCYGPTESAGIACCHTVTSADLELSSIPIGRPIANTSVRILDKTRLPVSIGTPGDLYIGGDCLALGYTGELALTTEKFIQLGGERFFRTGDRALWLPSGAIQFLGRKEHRLESRGYYAEPAAMGASSRQKPRRTPRRGASPRPRAAASNRHATSAAHTSH